MNKSKLAPKSEYIASSIAAGVPQTQIARQLQVNQSTISRFSSKTEIQAAIEEQTKSLLEVLPDAVANVKSLITGMKDLSPKETKRIELALKASFRVLESSGLLNSSTPSQTIISLTKADNTYLSPEIDGLLKNLSCTEKIAIDHIEDEES